MIFVTVGHQTPFDRLVKSVDDWARDYPDVEIFAQIGDGEYQPESFPFERWLTSERFLQVLDAATAVVSHAGTGTILQAVIANKPLLVLPRRAALHETRNNHQIGTATYFAEAGYVLAVDDEAKIGEGFSQLTGWLPKRKISAYASPDLIENISKFIAQ